MKTPLARTAFFGLLFLLVCCAGPTPSENDADAQIVHLFRVSHSAGGIVEVAKNGRPVYLRALGYRNRATNTPVDSGTRFEIGSVTKQFTAAAILQLKERGKLRLDDVLSGYLPSFPHAAEVTLRELLNQTSGLPDYDGRPDFGPAYASAGLHFRPGSRWEYSNTNYYVLSRVIEVASHETYENYVRTHLFRAARMRESGFISDEPAMRDFAIPYYHDRIAPTLPESWASGAGAIVSTAGDLVKWDVSLAGGKIVSAGDYALMTSPARLANGQLDDYGMGLSVDREDGHRRISHNGATNGSVAINSVFPADNIAIVVLENTSGGIDPGILERAVLEEMFPDALATARKPAPGETAAIRNMIVPMIGRLLSGTLSPDETSPAFRKFWLIHRKAIAAYWSAFGAPQREIFKGLHREHDGTWYDYRIEFSHDVRECEIEIDNAHRLSNLSIAPPS